MEIAEKKQEQRIEREQMTIWRLIWSQTKFQIQAQAKTKTTQAHMR